MPKFKVSYPVMVDIPESDDLIRDAKNEYLNHIVDSILVEALTQDSAGIEVEPVNTDDE